MKKSDMQMIRWLHGVQAIPAYWHEHGQPFREGQPTALVVHSGSLGEGVAEYLAQCSDRRVSAHFAWSKRQQALVQQVALDLEAWHAGGSTINGVRANGCALGIELSGPWDQAPRRQVERDAFSALVDELVSVVPTLRYWTTHSAIKATKRDPGPGFSAAWMEPFGLERVGPNPPNSPPAPLHSRIAR